MKKLKKLIFGGIIVAIIGVSSQIVDMNKNIDLMESATSKEVLQEEIKNTTGNMVVDYIDVGQGDATLVSVNGKNMLIDAGKNETEEYLVKYIKDKGITRLDYVIGTHPHEDHVGGLDKVIDNFEIGEVIMPEVTHTTKTFESVVKSASNKGLKIKKATAGMNINLGAGTKTEVFSPSKEKYQDLNDYSPIMKITHGERKFLFTGDAEKDAENEVINNKSDASADILKVGHHGSTTSTTETFLDKVSPKIAIISCGENNDYGHPHKEVLKKLSDKNIEVIRTDEKGTIVVESDGKNINVK